MRKIITGIINLDINNIKSVFKATEIFSKCYVINDYRDFKKNTDCLILPGNGFFYEGAKNLKNKNLFDLIQKFALDKKKIIGICLGMHLLMENSEESPNIEGLGIIEGSVNKITNSQYKLPLLGWYDTKFKDNFFDQINLYYNNQFACNPRIKDLIIGNIGDDIPSIIKKDYIFGLQFHPEKSSDNGLKILEKILTKY
jgi:glutamine amidotransferase